MLFFVQIKTRKEGGCDRFAHSSVPRTSCFVRRRTLLFPGNDWKWNYREEADLFTSLLADVSKQTTTAGIAIFVRRDFRAGFRCVELLHIING